MVVDCRAVAGPVAAPWLMPRSGVTLLHCAAQSISGSHRERNERASSVFSKRTSSTLFVISLVASLLRRG